MSDLRRVSIVVRTMHDTYNSKAYKRRAKSHKGCRCLQRPPPANRLASKWRAVAERAFVALPRLEEFSLEVWGSPTSVWTRSEAGHSEVIKPPSPWDSGYMDREHIWPDLLRMKMAAETVQMYLDIIEAVSSHFVTGCRRF